MLNSRSASMTTGRTASRFADHLTQAMIRQTGDCPMAVLSYLLWSGLVDVEAMKNANNRVRLDTAFTVADKELGIARYSISFLQIYFQDCV